MDRLEVQDRDGSLLSFSSIYRGRLKGWHIFLEAQRHGGGAAGDDDDGAAKTGLYRATDRYGGCSYAFVHLIHGADVGFLSTLGNGDKNPVSFWLLVAIWSNGRRLVSKQATSGFGSGKKGIRDCYAGETTRPEPLWSGPSFWLACTKARFGDKERAKQFVSYRVRCLGMGGLLVRRDPSVSSGAVCYGLAERAMDLFLWQYPDVAVLRSYLFEVARVIHGERKAHIIPTLSWVTAWYLSAPAASTSGHTLRLWHDICCRCNPRQAPTTDEQVHTLLHKAAMALTVSSVTCVQALVAASL